MTMYRLEQKTLYFAAGAQASIHFVPNINWETYLLHRKNVPQLCKIFDTIQEAEETAACQ